MRCCCAIYMGSWEWGKEKANAQTHKEDKEQGFGQGLGGSRAEGCPPLSMMRLEKSPGLWRMWRPQDPVLAWQQGS